MRLGLAQRWCGLGVKIEDQRCGADDFGIEREGNDRFAAPRHVDKGGIDKSRPFMIQTLGRLVQHRELAALYDVGGVWK